MFGLDGSNLVRSSLRVLHSNRKWSTVSNWALQCLNLASGSSHFYLDELPEAHVRFSSSISPRNRYGVGRPPVGESFRVSEGRLVYSLERLHFLSHFLFATSVM